MSSAISIQLIHQQWNSDSPIIITYDHMINEYSQDENLDPPGKVSGFGEIIKIQDRYLLCSKDKIFRMALDRSLKFKDHSMLHYGNCSVLKVGYEIVIVVVPECVQQVVVCEEYQFDLLEVETELEPTVKRKYTEQLDSEPQEEFYSARHSKILRLLDENAIASSRFYTLTDEGSTHVDCNSVSIEPKQKINKIESDDWDDFEIDESMLTNIDVNPRDHPVGLQQNKSLNDENDDNSDNWDDFDVNESILHNSNAQNLKDENESDNWDDFDIDEIDQASAQIMTAHTTLSMNMPDFKVISTESKENQPKLFDLQGESATPTFDWRKDLDLKF